MTARVVIAGGGPNGLLLASELALAGVEAVVLERLPRPAAEVRANGLVGRVAQALDYRGLYERFAGEPLGEPGRFFQFGGLPLDLGALADNPLYGLRIPQPRLEELLAGYAGELGVDLRRGHELTGFSQDADGVTVEVEGPAGGYSLRAAYLVGCDGAHSLVRKEAGIGFPGTTDEHFVSRNGDVVLPESATDSRTGEVLLADGIRLRPYLFNRMPGGLIAIAQFRPGLHRVAVHEWNHSPTDPSVAPTLTELRAAVRRVVGADLPMSEAPPGVPQVWRQRVGLNSRQAESYRAGRVLLAGDAAHVHSSVGAPGLNLGMQDVFNLGWKLAGAVHGWAPEGLLDTYETERQPVGSRVLMHTRAQTALFAPGSETTALRELFGELLSDEPALRRIADLLAGADVRYDMPAGGDHPLVGRWMPDLPLHTAAGPTSVAALLHRARPVLLHFSGGPGPIDGRRDRVDVVHAETADPPAGAVLVRPDGYVAWAGSSDFPGLTDALATWFGSVADMDVHTRAQR